MIQDPTQTDGDKYKVIFENEKVRVLEYTDKPGEKTHEHHHPDSLMYFLSDFKRQLSANGKTAVIDGKQGTVSWLKEQNHTGANIGNTDTHVLLIELKENKNNLSTPDNVPLGPENLS